MDVSCDFVRVEFVAYRSIWNFKHFTRNHLYPFKIGTETESWLRIYVFFFFRQILPNKVYRYNRFHWPLLPRVTRRIFFKCCQVVLYFCTCPNATASIPLLSGGKRIRTMCPCLLSTPFWWCFDWSKFF